jgi:deoxyribose-phosphate aldolase
MIIDYCLSSCDINEAEARENIKLALEYTFVKSITVPYFLVKSAKSLIGGKIILSTLIDYPLGFSDCKTRSFASDQAIKSGVDFIDIAMPQNLASNRKYDKIRDDIKSILDVCSADKIRYILEYRYFDHNCLKKVCEIFDDFNIRYIFPSSGFFIDNLSDNILASIFLYKNSKEINIFSTGNIWNDSHFETINKSGLYGFRTYSIECLKNYNTYNFKRSGV